MDASVWTQWEFSALFPVPPSGHSWYCSHNSPWRWRKLFPQRSKRNFSNTAESLCAGTCSVGQHNQEAWRLNSCHWTEQMPFWQWYLVMCRTYVLVSHQSFCPDIGDTRSSEQLASLLPIGIHVFGVFEVEEIKSGEPELWTLRFLQMQNVFSSNIDTFTWNFTWKAKPQKMRCWFLLLVLWKDE